LSLLAPAEVAASQPNAAILLEPRYRATLLNTVLLSDEDAVVESSFCQGNIKAASKQTCHPRGKVIGDVTHEWEVAMPIISRILAATMFLLAIWTCLGLTGTQRAQAEPPNPCDVDESHVCQ
jgi:hypothetical protein